MKAELVLLGMRIDMARRARRRMLVILIYAAFALLIAGFWFADRERSTGAWILLAVSLACQIFLGGTHSGGLIKPFNGKVPAWRTQPSLLFPLQLRLGLYRFEPDASDYRNDERELRQRDRAHYQAYQPLIVALCVAWVFTSTGLYAPRMVAWLPVSAHVITLAVLQVGIVLGLTLPQAILLWTEPDMETDTEMVGDVRPTA